MDDLISPLDQQIQQQESRVSVVRHQVVKALRAAGVQLPEEVQALLVCEERETAVFHGLLRRIIEAREM